MLVRNGTTASDVFSFGLVLWQIAAQQPLWSNVPNRNINTVLQLLKEGKAQQELTLEHLEKNEKEKEQVDSLETISLFLFRI